MYEQACLVLSWDVFSHTWLASQQKFIVKAYPIDGHICTVMNPIQWRDKWRGLWEVPGQCGLIQHVSIVLKHNRHDRLQTQQSRSSPCFKRFTVTATPGRPLLLPSDRHCTCFISSNVRGYWDWTGPRGERVFSRLLTLPTWKNVYIINVNHSNLSIFCSETLKIMVLVVILPFSESQSHRQTWELLAAWVQREPLWTVEKQWCNNHIIHISVIRTSTLVVGSSIGGTCLMTSLMANSFSVGSPASESGAS